MKTTLAFIALLATTAFASMAVANIAGVTLPAFISVESLLSLFTIAGVLLVLAGDYGTNRLALKVPDKPLMLPAAAAFGSTVRATSVSRPVRPLSSAPSA
jgi:hypothetical protein